MKEVRADGAGAAVAAVCSRKWKGAMIGAMLLVDWLDG